MFNVRILTFLMLMGLGVHLPTHAVSLNHVSQQVSQRTGRNIITVSESAFQEESGKLNLTYSEALKLSQEEGKPILLFFSGSDWSGLSMKMKNEIIDTEEFQSKIAPHFICVEIEFPRHKELSLEIVARNKQLKKQFKITEYPALLLIDSDRREITRLGYLSESGKQLAEDLLRIVKQDRELCKGLQELPTESIQLQRLYQLAQELRRTEAIDKILQAGFKTDDPFFLLEKYRLLVEEGKMHSDEAVSLREVLIKRNDHQIHFTVALIEFQELAASERDPKKAIRPLSDYLECFGDRDCENVWRIEMMIAQFYLEADEWPSALKHAETAYQNAPDERREEIQHSLDYIRSQTAIR